MLLELAPQLMEIARAAGAAIMAVPQATTGVTHKTDHSPLTEADTAAHHCIASRLAALTPGIPVVSEEYESSWTYRQPLGMHWLLDPLDGTKEFLAGSSEFTVNIALIRDSAPVLGVVFAPDLDLMYWGGPELGAFRISLNGKVSSTIRVTPHGSRGPICRVVASKSHLDEETCHFMQHLGLIELMQVGSSLKFCRLAEGAADIYPRLGPTCEWDTAAAQAVLEGAGGVVVDLNGTHLRYGKTDIHNPPFVAASSLCAVPYA